MTSISLIDGHIDEPVKACDKCKLLYCDGCSLYDEKKVNEKEYTKHLPNQSAQI